MPGPLYCEASALFKLYFSEAGSDEFNRTVEGREDLIVSDLTVTEIASALARRLREGAVTPDVARRALHAVIGRLDAGGYGRVDLVRDAHRRAEHFLLTLTNVPLRAADALHLALAMSAGAASMASFDVRLRAAASAAGLATYPA